MRPTTTQVWEQFSQQLQAFIFKRVSNPQDAEDILQDVFLKLHTHLDSLQDEQRLVPWLYQIARHAVIDYYRRQRPDETLQEALSEEPQLDEDDPQAHLAAGLGAMIDLLPEKYRQPLVMSEFQGLKQQEIAERLGISLSGAKSRVQRGRLLLRDALLECCHFEFDRRGNLIDYLPRVQCCRRCCN